MGIVDDASRHTKTVIEKTKDRTKKYGLFIVNSFVVVSIAVFVIAAQRAPAGSQEPLLHVTPEDDVSYSPLDTLSSADIAVNVALMTGLPETTAVINHSDSASTLVEGITSGVQTIAKPQILKTNLKSKLDIVAYTVTEGDTVKSLARQFGVSSDSIRWSNDLEGNTLKVGAQLYIPPIDGIVHKVSDDDTPATLAAAFEADETRIIAYNDAEIDGLVKGERIIIPDGEVASPAPAPSFFTASTAGFTPAYGGNGYDYGWCTWHAANRRLESGKPMPRNLGNAVTWSPRARRAGMTVSDTPVAGAIIWHDQSVSGSVAGGLGHVAFVEKVNEDGSIIVSDMNSRGFSNLDGTGAPAGGWSRVSYRKVNPSEFHRYDFIH